jgi:hypothetical protein
MPGCMRSAPPSKAPNPPASPGRRPRTSKASRIGVGLLGLGIVCCFLYFPVGLVAGLFLIMAGGVTFFTER